MEYKNIQDAMFKKMLISSRTEKLRLCHTFGVSVLSAVIHRVRDPIIVHQIGGVVVLQEHIRVIMV